VAPPMVPMPSVGKYGGTPLGDGACPRTPSGQLLAPAVGVVAEGSPDHGGLGAVSGGPLVLGATMGECGPGGRRVCEVRRPPMEDLRPPPIAGPGGAEVAPGESAQGVGPCAAGPGAAHGLGASAAVPHSPQKASPAGMTALQFEHLMERP